MGTVGRFQGLGGNGRLRNAKLVGELDICGSPGNCCMSLHDEPQEAAAAV
jgi:hypothetical protein